MIEAEIFIAERGMASEQMRTYYDRVDFNGLQRAHQVREEYIGRFGFAILTRRVVQALAPFAPLLEVGCGSGYWSYELKKAGVDVIATDPGTGCYRMVSDTEHWREPWLEIERITGEQAVRKYPDRSLLMIWPDREEDWPADTLQAFEGAVVLYGGEGPGGCTADDRFHDLLENDFEQAEVIALPQFPGIHDDLEVWRRK